MLARSVLRYRLFSLAAVPPAERRGALLAQLAAWQAFPDSVYLVDLLGDQAQVFAADRQQLAPHGLIDLPLWPESLLHEPAADGVRLLQSLEGFEAQAWRSGVLVASRWWSALPDLQEWQAFARQARVAAQQRPEPQALSWLKPARQPVRAEQLGQGSAGQQKLLVLAVALVLLAFASMTARDAWDARQRLQTASAELQRIKEGSAPLLAAREKALALADRSAALSRQLAAPQPLELFEQLGLLLPKGSVVKELDLQGRNLKLALELPPEVSRANVVQALESGAWLTQVSEVKDGMPRSWVSFEMRLEGVGPPRRASTDAGLKRAADETPAAPPPLPLPSPTPPGRRP